MTPNVDPAEEIEFLKEQLRLHLQHNREAALLLREDRALPPMEKQADAAQTRSLEELSAFIGDCRRCPLGDTRNKIVFGVGNPQARVMLIGEGPGFSEDRQGEPFVGPAGQLLDKILEAVQLSRKPKSPAWQWVYIANVVKCHPMIDPAHPENRGNDRPPEPGEIDKCIPYLHQQIRLIKPDYVVALGGTAMKALLGTSRGITSIHGQWQDFRLAGENGFSCRLLPLYHPAALLRDPARKKDVWQALKPFGQELSERYS
jgi:DNA polymerase